MKGILNTVLLVPGDIVYVVTDLKGRTAIESEVEEVVIKKNSVQYVIKEGIIKCSKVKGFKPGQKIPCVTNFKNADIDTRFCVKPWEIYIFKSKEKCLKLLRGE